MTADTGLLLRRLDQRLSLFGLARATDPPGQKTRPVIHQDTPALEQVRGGIGRLDPVPDHMRQGRFLAVVPVWITLTERFLIDYFKPVWNLCLDGFVESSLGMPSY